MTSHLYFLPLCQHFVKLPLYHARICFSLYELIMLCMMFCADNASLNDEAVKKLTLFEWDLTFTYQKVFFTFSSAAITLSHH